MKICFIAPKTYQLFNPAIESTFGGAEVQLSLLAKEIVKKFDSEVFFIVGDYGQKNVEIIDGVNIRKFLSKNKSVARRAVSLFKVIISIKADVYIQRTLTSYSWLLALLIRLMNKKFVYMVAHDSEVDGTHTIQRSRVGRMCSFLNFKLANKIIVQNDYQKNHLKTKSTILNSSFNFTESEGADKSIILWVGRSENWKQPEIFLKIASSLPNEKFIMVCPPATNNKKKVDEIKSEVSKINNLQFEEFIPFNKIGWYFERAKIFINTSKQEGFPNTFLQAMASKTPIVSLNVNPNQILDNEQCGFFCNNDHQILLNSVRRLLENKDLSIKMGQNGFNYVKKNHDVVQNAQKLIDIIYEK